MTRQGLLGGITIVDFGWAVAGTMLSRLLAQHGATVLKIESSARLDSTRIAAPFAGKPSRNSSGYFEYFNGGKQSVTINLKHEEGQRLARRLVLSAGIVNENFVPGVLERAGLGYEALALERPDLIMISSSSQGQDGPHARHPGVGVTLQGLVGFCNLTGWPDREPVGPGEPYTDTLVVGMAGAALMAALDYRRRHGRGLHIDVSQFETVAHALAPGILHEQLTGQRHSRMGNASLARAPEGVYACKGVERWIAVSIESDAQWRTLAGMIDFPAPAETQNLAWRFANNSAIEAAVSAWARDRDLFDVERLLQENGIPAHSVASGEDLANDVQLTVRGRAVDRHHPVMGDIVCDMPPFRLSEHPVSVERAPTLGEHTDRVLKSILGLSDDEIASARDAGALA